MPKETQQPFMTPVEIVRIIATAIGIKAGNKKLDENAFKYDQPYTLAPMLYKEVVADRLTKSIHPVLSKRLTARYNKLMTEYMGLVNSFSMDGVFREDIDKALTRWVLDTIAIEFNLFMGQVIDGPNFLARDNQCPNALTMAFEWLSKHVEWWDSFIQHIPKDKRHRIKNVWMTNEELPDFSTISNIPDFINNTPVSETEWQKIKSIILAAKYIDSLHRDRSALYPEKVVNISAVHFRQIEQYLREIRHAKKEWFKPIGIKGIEIDHIYYKKDLYQHMPDEQRKELSKSLFEKLEGEASQHPRFNMSYWLSWYNARWHTLNNDFTKANGYFKSTFENALFLAGPSMPEIIKESLAVAANVKPRPDKAFIKRLKNAAIMFGIEIPLYKDNPEDINKNRFQSYVEDWELALYKASLGHHFPAKLLFVEASRESFSRVGPLIADFEKIKSDYSRVNKKVKVGGTWKKEMPQIVYFSWMNRPDIVEKLLKEGASVNVLSDSNESALLFALLQMEVMEYSSSMDDRLFNIISSKPHNQEVINTKTSKKKLLPITSAVETGRPDIVDKVIKMGANVNFRGCTDNQTPLFLCLSRIGMLKRPEIFRELMGTHPLNDELIDTIKRHSNGLLGTSPDEIKANYSKQLQDPFYRKSQNQITDLLIERVTSLMTLESMRGIASLLIEAGSFVNAKHKTRIPGFTPLMLAAELDELELFENMIEKDGNPFITVQHPETGAPIDCRFIAEAHQSKRVLDYLKRNEAYLFHKFKTTAWC